MLASLALSLVLATPRVPPELPKPSRWRPPVAQELRGAGVGLVALSDAHLPLVTLVATVQAGSELDPPELPGLASAVAQMLEDGGAGTRGAKEVSAAFESLGAELAVATDPSSTRLAVTVVKSRLPQALALLRDLLVAPRFDAAEWERVRAELLAALAAEKDEPSQVAGRFFLRQVFGKHPLGTPASGTAAAVSSLRREDLVAFHQSRYGPQTTHLVVTGDVEAQALTALVKKTFAGWTSKAAPVASPPAPKPSGGRWILVDRPGAPQTVVRVGAVGLSRSSPKYPQAMLLATALGGSFTSRLVRNLREKHGYTYGAGSRFTAYRSTGMFVASTSVRTDVTGPALGELLSELRGIREGLTADELPKSQRLLEAAAVESFETPQQAALALSSALSLGQPLDSVARLLDEASRLDQAALAEAAPELIPGEEGLVVVLVGDRQKVEPQLERLGKKAELLRLDE